MPSRRAATSWLVLLWVLSRAGIVALLVGPESAALGDLQYFARVIHGVGDSGFGGVLPEYPVAGVLLLGVPAVLSAATSNLGLYGVWFLVLTLAVDAAFTIVVRRAGADDRAALTWIVLVAAMGGLTYSRFDVVTGVLLGVAVLSVARAPLRSIALVGTATAIKLWPLLLVAPMLAAARRPVRGLAVLAGVGIAAVTATLVLGGWQRVVSPLTYQADRGLQIEAVPATPVMLAHWWRPGSYAIAYSDFKAYEVRGAGVHLAELVGSGMSLLGLAVVLVVWGRVVRARREMLPDTLVWSCLALTLTFICADKVLSPQYMLWVAPVAVAGLVTVSHTRGLLVTWTWLLAVTLLLSHLIFPILYTDLVLPRAHSWLAVSVLASRNICLVGLWVTALSMTWQTTRTTRAGHPAG